ncbi:tRNA pseudouridine(55) synthase TruB [bacterium]|nr:tRNA pseudouridine(55) synthase TruB [bacterium]
MDNKKAKISGGYLIYKPRGLTSRQVDNRIGKLLRTKRVGHLGTLDPLAEGLMPVLVGLATRIAPFIDSGIKSYRAEITLGIATDTDDAEGKIIEQNPVDVSPAKVFDELKKFLGEIEQVPPKYSAKKINGVPMYVSARRGEEVIAQPKKVTIYSIENVEIGLPIVKFDVECSTGTYLRSIARDLGNRLGCAGHLTGLVRTRVGPHTVNNSVKLDDVVASIKQGNSEKYLSTETELLPHIPKIRIDGMKIWQVSHGQIVEQLGSQFKPGQIFGIVNPQSEILAIAEKIPGGYKYKRVLMGK